jgi:hypothetical protein
VEGTGWKKRKGGRGKGRKRKGGSGKGRKKVVYKKKMTIAVEFCTVTPAFV